MDSVYGLDGNRYNSYGFDSNGRPSVTANGTSGSTALYHHNGSRYGLGLPARSPSGAADKMNGLHGPKHKRGDIDRECALLSLCGILNLIVSLKSTGSQALALRIYRARFPLCAKINTAAVICKRSWRKVFLSIAI